MSSDNQMYALLTVLGVGLGAIATAIKWSVGQIVETWKDNTKATIDLTRGFAVLTTDIKTVREYVEKKTVPPQNAPQPKKGRVQTNPLLAVVAESKKEEP